MTMALYNQVRNITEEYLGPAADSFLKRQIKAHLNKNESEISVSDLPKLLQWAKVSLGLLTNDKSVIDDFVDKVSALNPDKDTKGRGLSS